MINENIQTLDGQTPTQLEKEEAEIKQYRQQYITEILDTVMKNSNNRYWRIKLIHASGHGWQNINHGNSKVQLHFNLDNFYNDFDIKDKTWEDFVKIVWWKNISHNQSILTLENQETRDSKTNKIRVLEHLKVILLEFFKEEKERVQTEISREQREERLSKKRRHSEKKWRRKKFGPQDIE